MVKVLFVLLMFCGVVACSANWDVGKGMIDIRKGGE